MKLTILFATASVAILTSLTAQAESFRFGIDKGSAQIGHYSVKTCKILIPDMGDHTQNVINQLKAKGYSPEVSVEIVKGRKLNKGEYIGSEELHQNPAYSGTPYIAGELAVGLAAAQSTLRIEVAGEKGAELYTSSKYTLFAGRDNAVIFSTDKFPNCLKLTK